jgi:predicted ATPase
MIGHRLMGVSLLGLGEPAEARPHFDGAIALYDPIEHRPLGPRFGVDMGVGSLSYRSLALWILGYPQAALADADRMLKDARDIGQAADLMHALYFASDRLILCGKYRAANALLDEVVALANEKGALFWKALAMSNQGWLFALTGNAADAIKLLASGITAYRSTGSRVGIPQSLSYLARAYAELGQFDDAWRLIGEAATAIETSNEKWYEADIHRMAGEIAMKSPATDTVKAEAYFERALSVARQQQAKSWELRAAMNMARLWRDQGKRDEARDLLAPVYGWFTEGFDTLDLKEAKGLLEELAA